MLPLHRRKARIQHVRGLPEVQPRAGCRAQPSTQASGHCRAPPWPLLFPAARQTRLPLPPPPCPALRTGEKANEVMSPRPAKLQGASSQPNKSFIGFVKLSSGGQGPPGTRQHHRGKKEKQTMKLKGVSFPEPRLTLAIQERVSPQLVPPPPTQLWASVVQPRWQGPQPHSDTGFLGSHLGAPDPEIQAPEGLLGKNGHREVAERSLSLFHRLRARSELDHVHCRRAGPNPPGT